MTAHAPARRYGKSTAFHSHVMRCYNAASLMGHPFDHIFAFYKHRWAERQLLHGTGGVVMIPGRLGTLMEVA